MNCDICNKEVETKDEELIGAKMLVFKEGDDEYKVLRCDPCFEKDQSLRNYKKIETYSRVCGYIRPVQQWHKGKVEEYKDRVNFKQ